MVQKAKKPFVIASEAKQSNAISSLCDDGALLHRLRSGLLRLRSQ
jgi:hypothetical protein